MPPNPARTFLFSCGAGGLNPEFHSCLSSILSLCPPQPTLTPSDEEAKAPGMVRVTAGISSGSGSIYSSLSLLYYLEPFSHLFCSRQDKSNMIFEITYDTIHFISLISSFLIPRYFPPLKYSGAQFAPLHHPEHEESVKRLCEGFKAVESCLE